MSKFLSSMGWLTVIGAGATLAFAQYRSNETGRDIVTVLGNLPEELKQAEAEWQERLMRAVAVGRQAAGEREEEIERELSAQETGIREIPDFPA